MKSLSYNLKYILPKLKKASQIVLFLDYDGTLSPIVNEPKKAVLSSKTKGLLKRLLTDKRIILAIVTGRSLPQIKKLVGIDDIYYAGCHGLEIESKQRQYRIAECDRMLPFIRYIKKLLHKGLKGIDCVQIEDKDLILAIHYRRVRPGLVPAVKKVFFDVVEPYVKAKLIKIASGKKVLEARPFVEWDKGRYCGYLLDRLKRKGETLLPVYIGDDVTDESAFKRLRGKGITIFVRGEKRSSAASYYLNSTDEVSDFLNMLIT